MAKIDEQNAVQTLLNEINELKQRINTLEAWLWVAHPRTTREAITTFRPPDITYAVTDDNITIPLTSTSWYYGTATYCTRVNN